MATKDRAEMCDLLLEHIGVKAAGVTADANDTTLAGIIVDSVHSRLDKLGLVPFATSAFPEWSHIPFLQVAAADCSTPFQLGNSMKAQIENDYARGLREFHSQVKVADVSIPVTFRDY